MIHHYTRCLSRSRHRIRHSAAMCREWRWLNGRPGYGPVQHHLSGGHNGLIPNIFMTENTPGTAKFSTASGNGKPLLSCPINDAATNDTQEDRG